MSGPNCRRGREYFGRPWTQDLSISKSLATALCLVKFRYLFSYFKISFINSHYLFSCIVWHIYFIVHICVYLKTYIYLFIYLFVYLFFRVWLQALRDKELSLLDDSKVRLTDMSWHLMCVAVGQSPLGPILGVNSQLECQKQYTSLMSLFFPCSLHRNTFQARKRAKSKGFWKQHGSTEKES